MKVSIKDVDEMLNSKEAEMNKLMFEMDILPSHNKEWCDLGEKLIQVARERLSILEHLGIKE